MKKLILILCFLLIPVMSYPWSLQNQTALTSGELTASSMIYTGEVAISAILVITSGAANAKVVIDDSIDGTGTVITEITVVSTDNYGGRLWQYPVACSTGLYVTLTGVGASYVVEYIPRH